MGAVLTYDGSKRIVNAQDRIFDNTALGNNAAINSSAFRIAKVGARCEIEVYATTEITIADTKSLTVALFFDQSETGSFTASRTVYAVAASGSAVTIANGALICKYTPDSDVEHFGKLRVTCTGDQSADKVSANICYNDN